MTVHRALALSLATVVSVTACAVATAGAPSLGASDVTIASRILRPDEREVTPELRGVTLGGKRFDVATLRGHLVVINYWGSWCAPCRAETPELVALAAATERAGVRFVGINVRDERANAVAFARHYKIPYPSLYDPDAQTASQFGPMAPRAVPSTYLLDTDGRVAAFAYGRLTRRALQAMINAVIESPRPTAGAS